MSMEHKLKSPKIIRPSLVNRDSTGLPLQIAIQVLEAIYFQVTRIPCINILVVLVAIKSKSGKKHRHNYRCISTYDDIQTFQ